MIFNALIGNHDAHGKNYLLLYTEHGAELAPLYDALSTIVYPELSPRMAMKIGDQYELDGVMPRHWERFAKECELSAPMVRRRVMELATRVPRAADETAEAMVQRGTRSSVVGRVVDLLRARAARVRRSLETEPRGAGVRSPQGR